MDNGKLYPFDFAEYMKAIHNAPPGTWMDLDTTKPQEIAECTECHAQMDWCLTRFHSCGEAIA